MKSTFEKWVEPTHLAQTEFTIKDQPPVSFLIQFIKINLIGGIHPRIRIKCFKLPPPAHVERQNT